MDGRSTPVYVSAQMEGIGSGKGSDTALKLKSFISQNLYSEGVTNFTDSSPTETEVKHIASGNSGGYRVDVETPEPQPLTTSNVTIHDRIWSKDSPRSSMEREVVRKDLSPPLKGLGVGEDTFWRKAMNPLGSLSDTESEHSYSSQDTMIMITSEQSRRIQQSTSDNMCLRGVYCDDSGNWEAQVHGSSPGKPLKRRRSLKELGKQRALNDFVLNSYNGLSCTPTEGEDKSTLKGEAASLVTEDNSPVEEILRVEVEEAASVGRAEEQDDGYESIDNLSSGTSSSSSSTCSPTGGSPSVCSPDSQVPRGGQYLTVAPVLRDPSVNLQPPVPAVLRYGRTSPVPDAYNSEKTQDTLKTSYGYVNTTKVPSFRNMNEILRRKSNVSPSVKSKRDSFQEKLQALTLTVSPDFNSNGEETKDDLPNTDFNGRYAHTSNMPHYIKSRDMSTNYGYQSQTLPNDAFVEDSTDSVQLATEHIQEKTLVHHAKIPLRAILKDSSSSSGSVDTTDGFSLDSRHRTLKKKSVSFRIPEADHSDDSSIGESVSVQNDEEDPDMDQETGELSGNTTDALYPEGPIVQGNFRMAAQNDAQLENSGDRVADYRAHDSLPYSNSGQSGLPTYDAQTISRPSTRQEGPIYGSFGDPSSGEGSLYPSMSAGAQLEHKGKYPGGVKGHLGEMPDTNRQASLSSKPFLQVVLNRTNVVEENNKPHYSRTVHVSRDNDMTSEGEIPHQNSGQKVYRPPTPPGGVRTVTTQGELGSLKASSQPSSNGQSKNQAVANQLKFVTSVREKMDKEKAQYMELLEQFQRGQRQASPVGSLQENIEQPHHTGLVRSNSLNIVRHSSPQGLSGEESTTSLGKPKFVRTADIYKMLEDRRRAPESEKPFPTTTRARPTQDRDRVPTNLRPVRAAWGASSGQLYDHKAPLRASYRPSSEEVMGYRYKDHQELNMVPKQAHHGSLDRHQVHRTVDVDATKELRQYPIEFIHRSPDGFFKN